MSQDVKPIKELLKAPKNMQSTMLDYLRHRDYAVALRDEIADRLDYSSIWAAMDNFTEYTNRAKAALLDMCEAGYTSADALALKHYYDQQEAARHDAM